MQRCTYMIMKRIRPRMFNIPRPLSTSTTQRTIRQGSAQIKGMMNGDNGLDTREEEDSILSLSDPTYRHILEEFFIRLGPKTKGKKKVNESELTEADAAEEVFNMLKNKGGRLLKRQKAQKGGRLKNDSVVAIDDEEARKSKYHTMTGDCLTNLFC